VSILNPDASNAADYDSASFKGDLLVSWSLEASAPLSKSTEATQSLTRFLYI